MGPKRPHEDSESSGRARKKQKTTAARTIHVQTGIGATAGVVANSMAGMPGAIDVEKFTEARSFEIAAMQSAMETAKGSSTQRAWQTLPRSLRRRAASHDVRRVPMRLRDKARAEMDPSKRKALGRKLPKKGASKQITRTQSFLKRQRDKAWLETHIWHAKRMHMKNIWGYRLSETTTEKSYRPSHRSAVHSSILHDASYISTISVSGKQSILESLLIRCCDCQGAGPSAVRYTMGSRIHETHMYEPGAYPFGLIAPITVIWKPVTPAGSKLNLPDVGEASTSATGQSERKKRKRGKVKEDSIARTTTRPHPDAHRTLWIRFHPSAWQEVWEAVQSAASLTLEELRKNREANTSVTNESSKGKQKRKGKEPDRLLAEPEGSIELADLRSQVNCFEIMGPLSSQVLVGAITPVNSDDRTIFKQFWSQLKDLRTPGSVPRGMIVGMKVHDPRLDFPPKNAKSTVQMDGGLPSTSLAAAFTVYPNATLAQTEVWEEVERDGGALKPRFKKKDLDERRRQNLIPGSPLQSLRQDDRIPIMLIQRTASSLSSSTSSSSHETNDLEHMHGWTVLLPPHWSMPFFSSLTYTGTRVGGLRERRTQVFEAGSPDFPFDYPLTPAYAKEETVSAKLERERWERKPPAKRVAWESVNTRSPWRADWEVVLGLPPREVQDEGLLDAQREPEGTNIFADTTRPIWLLRGPDTPSTIDEASTSQDPAVSLLNRVNVLRAKRGLGPLDMEGSELLKGALVPVKLHLCGRGAPDDLAAIYEVGVQEGVELRKMLVNKKGGDIEGDADAKLSTMVADDSSIIGYVTTGKYSLSRGKGYAIGAVSAARLIAISDTDKNLQLSSYSKLVKVKDRESAVCRAALLEILTI